MDPPAQGIVGDRTRASRPSRLLVGATIVYSGMGADIVME
jgi:hypothetical protein